MIIIILGGIGSGKSLSLCKNIVDNKTNFAYTNFKLKNIKNYYRIKKSDILQKNIIQPDETHPKPKEVVDLNWGFWKKVMSSKKYYSIYLDEVHNIIHARRSMTRTNVLMSKWVSQIRKILGDSKYNNLYLISQTLRKIDVDFRELAEWFVVCRTYEHKDRLWVRQTWYHTISDYEIGKKSFSSVFLGNNYFKYYNTKEVIDFEEESEVYL